MAKAWGRWATRLPLPELPVPPWAGQGNGQALELAASGARGRWSERLSLFGLLLLSLGLNAWDLSKAGYGNTYYAAAVRSMTLSWRNFFFAAFDPGGFITVDKPPVFLWVDALAARIFGYSSWTLLLPSAIAGAATVVLLWLIVKRYFGLTAATVAGVVLALTPITVGVDRLNLPEPFMILWLVGAAGAVLRSIESKRWWVWTATAGFLVGIAFNTKMLAGWVPGPAFAAAIVTGAGALTRASLRPLLGRLVLLAAVTFAVSASWMLVVDAVPASARPYIGGSTNNTVSNLVFGYNGFGRIDGQGEGGIGGGGPTFSFGLGGGGFNGAGGIIGGSPSLLRMFDSANGGQIGWLLPFALGSGLLVLWLWRRDPVLRSFSVVFLGWVLLYGGVFSIAQGIYHSYYTSAMAPAVAALVGAGSVGLTKAVQRHRPWLMALAALVGVTLWTQLQIAGRTPDFYGWIRPLTIAMALAGIALAVALAARRLPRPNVAGGVVLSMAGLLLIPGAWSASEMAQPALNATLPQAGPHQGASGVTFGSAAFDSGTASLAAWLKAQNDTGLTWDLVVSNAQNGSQLIAQYGIPVMAIGGFLGRDNSITLQGFADKIASGQVRYVLTSGGFGGGRGFTPPTSNRPFAAGGTGNGQFLGPGGAFQPPTRGFGGGRTFTSRGGFGGGFVRGFGGGQTAASAVMAAVTAACTPVNDTSLPQQYQGSIYDCAGKAAAVRAQAG